MKKAILALPLFLLISGCTTSTPNLNGEVVACSEIVTFQNKSGGKSLDCLDGSAGVPVDLIKGPAIINVWGSWCEPCRDEIPFFRDFYAQMDSSIQLIGIDVEEQSPADGQEFVRDYGITWPNLYDKDGSTRKYFGMGVPVTWFIGSNGETVFKHIGPIKSVAELKELSQKHLGAS
jgi:thiol-disulfide isomerase/thioredoxin